MKRSGRLPSWYQIGLGTLLILMTVCALFFAGLREWQSRSELEGSWLGTGRYAHLRMVFHRDEVIIENRAGAQKSRILVDPAAGSLDIYSDDGIRHGLYKLAGDRLDLRLADVGTDPPTTLHSKASVPQTMMYTFERED